MYVYVQTSKKMCPFSFILSHCKRAFTPFSDNSDIRVMSVIQTPVSLTYSGLCESNDVGFWPKIMDNMLLRNSNGKKVLN